MQSNLFYCRITLHVSGVTAPIISSAKKCKKIFVNVSKISDPDVGLRKLQNATRFH